MEITYTNHDGFYLPNLTLPKKEEASFGRYGRLRLKYLKEHRRVLYINLLTSGELTQHLDEVDRQAQEMLERLVKQMAQAQGITEQLKVEDQMAWVGAMNNIRSAAEEVVMQEVVFGQQKWTEPRAFMLSTHKNNINSRLEQCPNNVQKKIRVLPSSTNPYIIFLEYSANDIESVFIY